MAVFTQPLQASRVGRDVDCGSHWKLTNTVELEENGEVTSHPVHFPRFPT